MTPLPCPFAETCGGVIKLTPDVNGNTEHEMINGQQCIMQVTITCFLIAECSSCSFVELIPQETQIVTFDQFYSPSPSYSQNQLEFELED